MVLDIFALVVIAVIIAAVDARGRIATSLVSTYRALGGGWQLREGNSVVHPSTLDTMRERTDWGNLLDN